MDELHQCYVWASNTGMKRELSVMDAPPGFVLSRADLFLQISYLKMFGWNLSDCLGLLYFCSHQHGYPGFTFRTDNTAGEDSFHSLEDGTGGSGAAEEEWEYFRC